MLASRILKNVVNFFIKQHHNVTDFHEGNENVLQEDYPEIYTTYSSYLYKDKVNSILANYAAANTNANPLFLYLAIQSPHDPVEAPQEYQDLYVDNFPGIDINDKRLMVSAFVMSTRSYITVKMHT